MHDFFFLSFDSHSRPQDGTDMVLVSQEYINNLRRALDAERLRTQELEEDVRRLREQLSLLKVKEATVYRPGSSLNISFPRLRSPALPRESPSVAAETLKLK